jgi:hypothetical protein
MDSQGRYHVGAGAATDAVAVLDPQPLGGAVSFLGSDPHDFVHLAHVDQIRDEAVPIPMMPWSPRSRRS